jgi:hypothetical protein
MTNARALAQQHLNRTRSINILVRLRKEARDEISRLIAFLDASDEYVMTELEDEADLEDVGDTEPSLGSFDRMMNQEKSYAQRLGEFIPSVDAELDDVDDEASLGACESHPTGPSAYYAPSAERIYSPKGDQTNWGYEGSFDDREDNAGDNPEEDPAENGIADEDGLLEQRGHKPF